MKVKIYDDNIVHIKFPTQKELTMTMCRPQEFYECNSSKLRNKVFSFEQFIDHYVEKQGLFTYFSFWSGFNIPGPILEDFFDLFELTDRELELRKATRKFKRKLYYLIATLPTDTATLKHELVHAHYYLNPVYRQEVDVLIRHMRKNVRQDLSKGLRDMGYAQHVLNDEINAYMTTSSHKYLSEELSSTITKKDMKPFVELAKNAGLV